MTSHFEGQREHSFRERSNNACYAGIAYGQSFICKVCKQPRDRVGRKPVIKGYSKAGYKCAHCVASALSAAGIADKEKPASQAGKPQRVSQNQGRL